MINLLRVLAGLSAGVAVVFAMVIAVEIYSDKVHPLPPDSEHSMEVMCAHVAAYPPWVLATVVPMWGLTAFAGTWVADIIGRRIPSVVLGILVLAALGFNLSMLPYATWFKVVMPVGALAGLVLGTMSGCGSQSKDPSRKQLNKSIFI